MAYLRAAETVTPKQGRFVEEYLVDLNATQAAIRAGYSPKTAEQQGYRLLRNAQIAAAVEKGRERLSEETDITAKRVLAELARIAFLDPRTVFDEHGNLKPIAEWDEDAARALSGCDVTEEFSGRGADREMVGYLKKIRFWDKKGALELLGKHLALFTDKVEHNGNLAFTLDIGEAPDGAE